MQLQLDYLQFQNRLRLGKADGAAVVYDPLRRKDVALTPEELLRQLVLLYLLEIKKYPANRIRVEATHTYNGLTRRVDILVFDARLKPWLLVECKSPKVALRQSTFEQAARYNLRWQADYLAITNGLSTFVCALDHQAGSFSFLSDFPDFGE